MEWEWNWWISSRQRTVPKLSCGPYQVTQEINFTNNIAFMLLQYTNSIHSLHSQVSFEGFCEAYNDTIEGNFSSELVVESNKMLEGRLYELSFVRKSVLFKGYRLSFDYNRTTHTTALENNVGLAVHWWLVVVLGCHVRKYLSPWGKMDWKYHANLTYLKRISFCCKPVISLAVYWTSFQLMISYILCYIRGK